LDYSEDVFRLIERNPGVHYHGRISHDRLQTLLRSSSILLYPTGFPEISCMSVMQAMSCGCLPVVSDVGALPETTLHGAIVPCDSDDLFLKACTQILDQPEDVLAPIRSRMAADAASAFSTEGLVDLWLPLLK
jgi:glycosyltransferase involved in cell wall biosynthesis